MSLEEHKIVTCPAVEIGTTICANSAISKLLNLLSSVNELDGDIAEVGMYKGGSAYTILNSGINCKFYGFDMFENGMPNTNEHDWHQAGDFHDTSYEKVKDLLSKFKNAYVYKGQFPKENSNVISKNKFKFVHLDVDIYTSYIECLNFFYDKMISGGIILCDDYNAPTCPGAKKAIDEFAVLNNIEVHIGEENQAYLYKN